MANSYTPHYNLIKPENLADTNAWGIHLNSDIDTLDSTLYDLQSQITSLSTTVDGKLPLSGGTMTGYITLNGNPTTPLHAVPLQYLSANYVALSGGTMTGNLTLNVSPNNSSNPLQAATKAYVDNAFLTALISSGAGLPTTGGTMTGYLILNADPATALGAATKQYVDSGVATATSAANAALPKSGGTMTGALVLAGDPTTSTQAATKNYVDNNKGLPLTGGTMTGAIVLAGDPSAAFNPATKNYVDNNFVSKTGNITLGGYLTLNSDPTSALHASTKQYVDNNFLSKSGGSLSGTLNAGSITANSISGSGLTISCYTLTASGDITLSSDERIKTNVKTITEATGLINRLRGVSYLRTDTGKPSVGVIAQEVEKVIPCLVSTDEDGMKSVAYANLVGVLIEGIKELSARVDELERA